MSFYHGAMCSEDADGIANSVGMMVTYSRCMVPMRVPGFQKILLLSQKQGHATSFLPPPHFYRKNKDMMLPFCFSENLHQYSQMWRFLHRVSLNADTWRNSKAPFLTRKRWAAWCLYLGQDMRKCVLCDMQTTKMQISLHISAVWLAPLLLAA